jgi:hypothetical protein
VENVEGETVKRLSCEVKGQIDAYERSARGAGSPYSQMPSNKQKAGYVQHTSPTAQMPSNDGKIIEVLWQLKKLGKAKDTIDNIRKCLYVLKKHANLDNPDSVVTFVATYERNAGYKRNLIMAYEHYVKQYGLTWTKPRYHENAKMPKIPLEAKMSMTLT